MSYDLSSARAAGLSDRQIIDYLSEDRDYDVDGARQAGLTDSQIAEYMSGMDADTTSLLGSVGEAIKRVPGGLARGITSTFTGAGQLIPGLDDDMLVDTQRDIDQYIRETLNYDPAYDDSNIAAIGEGIGQIGSFLIPGLGAAKFAAAGKAAQRGLTSGVAASQSLALGAEERRQAEDRGIEISGGQEALSKASDVAIGALETFGMPFRVLRGLPKGWERTPDGSVFMRRLRSALKGAGREGVQEVVSSVARDLSASAIYDPERPIGESAADEFAVGAGAGGIFDFAFSLATGRYKTKAPPPPSAIQEPTEEEAEVEARLREEQAGRAEAGRQQAIDAARGEQTDLDRLDAGPPTAELAGRIGEEGVQIPDRSEEARTRFLNANDLDLPQYNLDVETADASVITERIANRLAERLPLGAEFDATSEVIEVSDPTTESGKRQIGPRIRDEQKRQEVANRLSEASRRLKQDVETEYTVTQSGLEYNPRQAEEVNRFGRVLPSTEARVLTADEVNTATGTDRTGTFDEDLKDMSPAQLEELGIPRSRWTMAQRINASRAKQGLSEVNTFTLSELRAQNKGDIGNLGSVLAGKDLESAAFPERTDQDAGAALDPNRPRQPITPVGRRPSLEYSAKTFDNVLSSNNAFNRLLSTKQMNISLDSQEMRGLIKTITGKTPSKKAPLENLSPQERQYLYHSIRRMPRFTDPTQIPDFSRQVPDAEAVRVLRKRVEAGRTGGIGVVAEGLLGGMERQVSRAEVDRTVREAKRTARKTEREAVDPIPEGQGLVTYDPEATDLAQKLRDMVAGFGLSDVVATRLVDRVGQATFDAQGNIVIPQDPVKAQEDSEQGYVTEGTFDPMTNVIQVGLDLVRQKVEQGGKTYEQAVAEVMSHEIVHALRQFDLFTPAEFSLLERMTRKYQKPGTGGTYANWASSLYSEKSAVEVQEEAIAEMISDALTDGVIIDGRQAKPSGKIRQLLQKIVDLFRSIAGFSKDVDVDSFAELVDRIKSGEVGARERGVVRTLNLTEKMGALPLREGDTREFEDRAAERGITKEQLAYRETPIEGVRGLGDTARSVRSDQPMIDEAMASRSRDLPPAENAQRTQVANTIGTYRKAGGILDKMTDGDRGLDFSSGLGLGANELGFESYEPFAREGVNPTYTSGEQIPAGAFDKITNLNTLNVVPREDRDTIVKSIASALAPNGVAVITTRGKEVMNAKGRPGPEPNSIITSRDTYQKGFTKPELVTYLQETLGRGFEVAPLNLGPAGATVRRLTDYDSPMDSRRSVGAPLTAAVQRAKDKYENVRISTEEDFFGRYWPQLLEEVGGTVSPQKLRVGAKRAMRDIKEWIDANPKFNDYYSEDLKATRSALEAEYGSITDTDFALYMFLNGINSPGTGLLQNVGDAIRTFDLYRRDGNFDAIKMGRSEEGNLVIAQAPFKISGLTNANKARTMKAFDQIVIREGGVQQAIDYLFEPVTMSELESFKKSLGYAGVGQKGQIRGLVEDATGQQAEINGKTNKDQLIPRMFFLGPKLGAYTMNLMGDNRYQTVDVWESRFIRSYFDNMFDTNTGITATVDEGQLFRDFSKVFSEEFEKVAGYKADPASLQAMRWFYMINAAKEAGYSGASTDATISELTERQIQNTRGTRYGGRTASDSSVRVRDQGQAQETEIDAPLASRRKLDPARVEKAVQENIVEAENSGFNVPKYSVKASPEAQYIARNPDAAISIDEPVESRAPNYDAQTQSAIDGLVGDRPERVDPMKQFMDATGETSTLGYQFTRAKQAAVNRYARLEKLNKKFFNNFLADTSSIAAVLFADRSRGVTAEAIKSGVPIYEGGLTQVVDFQHNGKKYRGLIDIIDLLMTKEHGDLSKLAQAYAISVRGKRLNEDGSVSPVTEEKARQIREAVAKYTDADGNNPIIEWYGAWQAYNNQVIKFLEDTGVISGEVSNNWREASDYIPFYRALDPNANIGKITKGAFGDLTKAGSFIPYKGSEAVVDIPLVEAIVKNVSAAIDMGMRNVAQQRIARDMQTLQLAKQVPLKGDTDYPTATFKVNGKPVRFEIYDPLIFESMQAIDSSGIENFSRMYFGPFSNILRESVTRSPGFMIANMMRDTLSAFVTSGANFMPIYDTVKNAASDISRLERTGVVGGYDFSVGTSLLGDDNIQKNFERELKRRNKEGSQLNIFTSLWDGLGRMTTRSDAATRQAVFDDVYARTGNLAEAHFQALEVLNFSRRGSNPVMRAITAAIPFLNARIQGLDVLFRGMVGSNNANKELNRTQAALSFAMRGMLISAFTAMYWMLTSDDDEYREARREERDNNWLIPLGDGRPALKIPIPFEVGFIFKTLPEVFLDTTFGERTGKQAFETVKRGVTSTLEFDPIFGIQAIAPVLEASVNHNSYTGGTVVPIWMSGLLPEEQKTEFTSELGQFIGNAMNISPMKIDHVLKGYTGTMGIYVLDWTDRAVRDPDIAERLKSVGVNITSPEFPAVASYELPVVRRFFASPQGTGLKQDFYDLYNDVRQTYNSINKLRKEGRYEELEELIARRGTLLDVKAGVYDLKQQLDVVRRRKAAIRRSEDIAPERKREMIEEIEDYENSMLAIVPEFEKRADRPVTRMFQ